MTAKKQGKRAADAHEELLLKVRGLERDVTYHRSRAEQLMEQRSALAQKLLDQQLGQTPEADLHALCEALLAVLALSDDATVRFTTADAAARYASACASALAGVHAVFCRRSR